MMIAAKLLLGFLFVFTLVLDQQAEVLANAILGRIKDGTVVSGSKYPFAVNLFLENVMCTGSLISSKCVLTAKHCVTHSPNQIRACAGGNSFGEGTCRYASAYYYAITAVELEMDVAIIKFEQPITDRATVAMDFNDVGLYKDVTAIGYGLTGNCDTNDPKLREANLMTLPPDSTCQLLSTNDMCVGDANRRASICPGDSGGPLLYNGKQVGVASRLVRTGDKYVDLYIRLSSPFISTFIQNIYNENCR